MDRSVLKLLQSLDDPVHLEHPPDFASAREQFRFVELRTHLDAAFACECGYEAGPSIQDASYLGAIEVPSNATAEGIQIHIRVSNFGRLTLVCPERPGCYNAEEAHLLIADSDRERVEAALRGLGYVAVPEEILAMPRDLTGRLQDTKQPASIDDRETIKTWYDRFFEYL